MRKWLSSLFCRHSFVQVDWFEASDGTVRFSMRQYRCEHCGKKRWIDGRYDLYI